MNLEKVFEILKIDKKIFYISIYSVAAFGWVILFFGKELGFESKEITDYKFLVISFSIISNIFVVFHIVTLIGVFIKKFCEYFFAEKEKKEYYSKAIKTIQRYGDLDGLGVLLSLLSFPPMGDHWQKGIPQNCQKRDVYNILQLFSEVRIDKNGYRKVLNLNHNYSHRFDFNKGFFEFLEEEYFIKNKHEKVDLTSNFVRSDV